MNEIAVIGGGAAGLFAAIFAAQNENHRVTIYESGERLGRKILATGNGRCNMTNINAGVEHYHGNNPKFILGAVNKFWVRETLDFFETLGVITRTEDGGRVYPYSSQASAVLDVLRFKAEELNVNVVYSFDVSAVVNKNGVFHIKAYDGRSANADKVIVATGGKAAPNLGSRGAGYEILRGFGHRITELYPSLVQVKTDAEVVRKLRGIKVDAHVTLGGRAEYGEVLFTEYGLSGPAVFSLSPYLDGQKTISLDLMPEYDYDRLFDIISARVYQTPAKTLESFLIGMLNKRVGQALMKCAGIEPLSRAPISLGAKELERLCRIIKKWDFALQGTMSWNNAQVTRGGVITDDFNSNTMESRLQKGLYAVGEVLDIDGDCGGYNLQWAWSSGYLAGSSV